MSERRQAETPPVAAVQRGYNTNLASEFFVLSMLYRMGFDANLTLGNKKSLDIAVVLGPGGTRQSGHALRLEFSAGGLRPSHCRDAEQLDVGVRSATVSL